MAMLKNLAEALKEPKTCTTLKLSVKGKELPLELFQLTELRELYLEASSLQTLPSFGALKKLELLSLKAPGLKTNVAELFLLPQLKNLKLIETPIEPLMITLQKQLAPLQFLTFKACGLKTLPLELGEFTTLVELMAPENELKELPFTFVGLTKLKRLNLDGNAFQTYPDQLKELPNLLHVSIDGNDFSDDEKARIQRHFGLTPN